MTTFSELVDQMVSETRRPDLLAEICSYVNQTIRELHFSPEKGSAVFLRDNLREDQLTANADSGFYWTIPKQSVYQGLKAVRYDTLSNVCEGKYVWAKEMPVGRGMNHEPYYYYRSGLNVYFYGYGGNSALISLAWYEYPLNCKYYPPDNTRPAEYNDSDGWTYPAGASTPTDQAIAQAQCSNWILLRWDALTTEGVRAKVYKRLSDDSRSKTSYSMYTTLRQGFYSSENADISGAW